MIAEICIGTAVVLTSPILGSIYYDKLGKSLNRTRLGESGTIINSMTRDTINPETYTKFESIFSTSGMWGWFILFPPASNTNMA